MRFFFTMVFVTTVIIVRVMISVILIAVGLLAGLAVLVNFLGLYLIDRDRSQLALGFHVGVIIWVMETLECWWSDEDIHEERYDDWPKSTPKTNGPRGHNALADYT